MASTTIYPSADAYIDSSNVNTNYNDTELKVQSTGGVDRCDSMVKFLLSSLPAGAVISAATLYMYCNIQNGTRVGNPCETTDGWTETGVTWNNAPAKGTSIGNFASGTGWKSLSVTSYVQGEWAGDQIVSFRIHVNATASPWEGQRFSSKEGANDPYLAVTYTVPRNAPLLGCNF